jgi:endoglucanase
MRRPGRGTSWIGAVAIALIATVSASIDGAAAPSASGQAFVRVNQVGYATGSTTKRAYLMASASEAGAIFSVKDSSGASVYSAPIGLELGKWSSRYPNVYALDFPSVTAGGTYTISVTGAISATSPRFRIAARTGLYRGALTNALAFYQVERDGPNFIPSALRSAAGHLNDQDAMTYLTPNANSSGAFKGDLSPLGVRIDASGGWWDAGDYLKFVQTTSYTVDLLLLGVRDFPAQMGPSSRSDFTAEGKFGADWLLRMWDDPTRTLYYQVGIGEGNANTVGDHDIWRLAQADDTFGGCTPAIATSAIVRSSERVPPARRSARTSPSRWASDPIVGTDADAPSAGRPDAAQSVRPGTYSYTSANPKVSSRHAVRGLMSHW